MTLRRETQDSLYNDRFAADDTRPQRDKPPGADYHDATELARLQMRLEGVGWTFHRNADGDLIGQRTGTITMPDGTFPQAVRVGAQPLVEWEADFEAAQTPDRLDSDALCIAAGIEWEARFD